MSDTLQSRVRRGAKWLDKHYPGWEELVNPDKIDLGSPTMCVLGQIYGRFYDGLISLRIMNQYVQHGYAGKDEIGLTESWKREIRTRRKRVGP